MEKFTTLSTRAVTAAGVSVRFEIAERHRTMLAKGLDMLDATLADALTRRVIPRGRTNRGRFRGVHFKRLVSPEVVFGYRYVDARRFAVKVNLEAETSPNREPLRRFAFQQKRRPAY